MKILSLSVLVGLVAVGLGQEEPAPISLNRTCEVPVSATVSPVTVFTANTTSMIRTTNSVLKLSRKVFKPRGANKKSIKEGRAATAVDIKSWVSNTKGWIDLCPEKPAYIQPRHWFIFGGRLCLTPLPWRDFRYPTMQCIYRSCQLVSRPLFFCRPDVPRVYTIPIYCFNTSTGKFQKEKFNIYTYRYCTCCRYGCPISDTLTRG